MDEKPKDWKSAILILFIVVGLVVAAQLLGVGSSLNANRVHYVGNDGWSAWSGKYDYLDGTMQHTIRPNRKPGLLHVEVETADGSLSMEVLHPDGTVLFTKDDVGSDTFDVEVPGKVTVRLSADSHSGSFWINGEQV